MKKQLFSALLAAAVGMSLVWGGTAPAQTPPEIPETVNIEDPAADANGLNDQGFGFVAGFEGNNSGGAYVGAADILKVWFTNDTETISTHILTTTPPPNSQMGLIYRVMFNPGDLYEGCIWMQGGVPSNTSQGAEQSAILRFECEDLEAVPGEIAVTTSGENGIISLTYPRSASPAFEDGAVLTAPVATTRAWIGVAGNYRTAPQWDNTEPGTDYTISSGAEKSPKKCPSKGKKKGKKKPKPRPTRATPTPTATDAPTTPPPGPDVMAMQTTPAPSASPTARPTSPPGQEKPCPRQQGKKKRRPRPRPTGRPTQPTPSPTGTTPTPAPTDA